MQSTKPTALQLPIIRSKYNRNCSSLRLVPVDVEIQRFEHILIDDCPRIQPQYYSPTKSPKSHLEVWSLNDVHQFGYFIDAWFFGICWIWHLFGLDYNLDYNLNFQFEVKMNFAKLSPKCI